MEKIYNPSNYSSSGNINIKEFFLSFKKALDKFEIFDKNEIPPEKSQDEFSAAFKFFGRNFTEEQKELLIDSCSIKNLDIENDVDPVEIKGQIFAKVISKFKPFEGPSSLNTIRRKGKGPIVDGHRLPINFDLLPCLDEKSKIDLKPGEHVLITLSVMRPYKYQFAQTINKGQLKLFKEITLLGSNTIADFRDMIDCSADSILCKEVSENPDFDLNYPSTQKLYPSGFIFIDGVFYNDFREDNSIDYSAVIRKWAEEKNIGSFTTSHMVNTRFEDLSPRISYPYVYQHKSCCEHIFTFSQIRLLNSDDSLCSSNYPFYSKIARINERYCVICSLNVANWLIVDCNRLLQSKAPLCSTCFKSYNYVDGVKIGSFKAYPYNNLSEVS